MRWPPLSPVLLLVVAMSAWGRPAFAQSEGRVVRDSAVIWRMDASVPAAVVPSGVVLEIVRRVDPWYHVRVPERFGGRGELGRISVSQVQLLPGSLPPASLETTPPPATRPAGPGASAGLANPRPPEPIVAVRAFGSAAMTRFAARQSFEAVFGDAYGFTVGGGAQIRFRNGLFVEGGVERFRETGERVFVFEDTVFPLGVGNTVTVTPLAISAGYRFPTRHAVVPYLGGGLSSYRLTQEAEFDAAGDTVRERHQGFHALGGIEVRGGRWVAFAVELQYATVPDGLGTGGVSEHFAETDLGGFKGSLKLFLGR